MSHRDDELPAHENGRVAINNSIPLQLGRADHQKQMVAVNVNLGQMLGIKRVFHGKRMKAKMVLNALKCTIVGFMQPNPDEIFWLGDMRNWFG